MLTKEIANLIIRDKTKYEEIYGTVFVKEVLNKIYALQYTPTKNNNKGV